MNNLERIGSTRLTHWFARSQHNGIAFLNGAHFFQASLYLLQCSITIFGVVQANRSDIAIGAQGTLCGDFRSQCKNRHMNIVTTHPNRS